MSVTHWYWQTPHHAGNGIACGKDIRAYTQVKRLKGLTVAENHDGGGCV